jgi:hypothetical protein
MLHSNIDLLSFLQPEQYTSFREMVAALLPPSPPSSSCLPMPLRPVPSLSPPSPTPSLFRGPHSPSVLPSWLRTASMEDRSGGLGRVKEGGRTARLEVASVLCATGVNMKTLSGYTNDPAARRVIIPVIGRADVRRDHERDGGDDA